MNRIGYCCISIGINEGKSKKDQIMVNRGMVRRTFDLKGLFVLNTDIPIFYKDLAKTLINEYEKTKRNG